MTKSILIKVEEIMKTKKKSLVLSLLLCLVLACSSIVALTLPKAKADEQTAISNLVTGGGYLYSSFLWYCRV